MLRTSKIVTTRTFQRNFNLITMVEMNERTLAKKSGACKVLYEIK